MKSFVFSLLLIACFLSISFRSSLCADTAEYTNCNQPITCGTVNISYPFWEATRPQYCGVTGFEVNCTDNVPFITMSDIKFRILEMDTTTTTPTVKVAREDYWGTLCPSKYVDTTLNFSLFTYSSGLLNLSIYYGCSSIGFTSATTVPQLCTNNNNASYLTQTQSVKLNPDPVSAGFCAKKILIPVLESASVALDSNTMDIVTAIDGGFKLDVVNAYNGLCNNCKASGGVCGQVVTASTFSCYCQNSSSAQVCDSNSTGAPSPTPSNPGILNCSIYGYAYSNSCPILIPNVKRTN